MDLFIAEENLALFTGLNDWIFESFTGSVIHSGIFMWKFNFVAGGEALHNLNFDCLAFAQLNAQVTSGIRYKFD